MKTKQTTVRVWSKKLNKYIEFPVKYSPGDQQARNIGLGPGNWY